MWMVRFTDFNKMSHIRACIPIKQSRRFHDLFPILAPLAFESIVRLAHSLLIELEQLTKSVNREMPLSVLLLVNYG